jgi:Spx/MgsR family transcriptional regulator
LKGDSKLEYWNGGRLEGVHHPNIHVFHFPIIPSFHSSNIPFIQHSFLPKTPLFCFSITANKNSYTMKIYGIKNCNTMQKAFKALDEQGLSYTFHDYKKLGIDAETLKKWCAEWGFEKLINKSGLTWKKLDDASKASVKDEPSAIALMMQHTSMIKRPVIDTGKSLILGFDENAIQKL